MSPWTGPASALPSDVKVCIVADRGNGRHKLCRLLTEELKFDYVIRFRGNTIVTAADWVAPDGRTRGLPHRHFNLLENALAVALDGA